MSIYISDAVVAGDTSVVADASPGSLAISGMAADATVGLSVDASPGALSLTGLSADSGAGISADPTPGALVLTARSAQTVIGVSTDTDAGSMTFAGALALAVARGRIAVVSSSMVLQSNPPTPIVCVSGRVVDETETAGALVEETTLSGYYQVDFKECK